MCSFSIQESTKKKPAMLFGILPVFYLYALLFVITSLLSGCNSQTLQKSSTHFLMDTLIQIDATGKSSVPLEKALNAAFARMREVADKTDRYTASSDCSAVNKAAGIQSVKVSGDLFTLVEYVAAQNHPEVTLTIGPLVDAWSVGKQKAPPDASVIQKAQLLVAASSINSDPVKQTLFLHPKGASLDLGAVAKGYAVDQAADLLARDPNIISALVNGGGNIRVVGQKPDKQPWRVAIKDPRDENALLGVITLSSGQAIATSGDYQRYFEAGGRRFHHILSPTTGHPARGNISVTVVAKSALEADYYSTLLFILPLGDSLRLLQNTPELHAVFVQENRTVFISPGLKDKFAPDSKGGWQYVQK